MKRRRPWGSFILLVTFGCLLATCSDTTPKSGTVLDEALFAKRDAASFPMADEDYFHDMDGGVGLTPEEIKGRNMWIVWSGGNDRFWDSMTGYTYGAFDLLKIVTSHPGQNALGKEINRDTRWNYLGLVNEPCFDRATAPDPQRFNLWLDARRQDCASDPFENEQKYPGVAIGARGKTFADGKKLPVGSYYGYATGIVGLRLFPNPAFDEAAEKRWDAERYYNDPAYYNDPNLIRPYRIGMSCGFCHVGPSPTHPPADATHPQWSNLSSSVGAQYMWVDRLFVYDARKDNFMFQLVHTYRPGAMDTSLVSTDNINNPRTMNAIYNLGPRLDIAARWGQEKLTGGQLDNKQFNDYVTDGPLTRFFIKPDTVWTPHVLKDGADSVGALGALNRVYLNIGLFSEEWLLHFRPVIGGKPISPIAIAVAEKNSSYWKATEAGTPDMALFFLKATKPDHLKDAPGGDKYLTADAATLDRGKTVFAGTCARCHSSKAPAPAAGLDPAGCAGPGYLDCWKRYWSWTQTEEYKSKMREIVHAPDFLDNNYLSTDFRVPVTLLRTNACSPLATNAIAGNIWDNFSSQSYKDLPSVGQVTIYDPFTGETMPYQMAAGGRGYTRPPSLISVWSTAPFLLNNSVGPFSQDPSVDSRMRVFQASIEQMLWPEKRDHDALLGTKVPGVIDRTTERSQINIPAGYVPDILTPLQGTMHRWFPWLVTSGGDVTLGPIPAGVPVNLLANIKLLPEGEDPAAHAKTVVELVTKLKLDLLTLAPDLRADTATDEKLRQEFSNLAKPLMKISKCPDFVVNRGHYFGTEAFNQQAGLTEDEKAFGQEPELSDEDKRALIEFLKTF
ncbi:MAG TPA: hypothetical protein VM639_22120 [Dongiaceae bacterium]|nr:hypothetical protein [Dongiaceae bacterium]